MYQNISNKFMGEFPYVGAKSCFSLLSSWIFFFMTQLLMKDEVGVELTVDRTTHFIKLK